MKAEKRYTIGIDIGGTFLKGGVVKESGEIIVVLEKQTPKGREFQAVTDVIATMIDELVLQANISFNEVKGIGIACPGTIDTREGIVIDSSNLKWKNISLKDAIEKKYSFPVAVLNDADAALLSEVEFGAGKDSENVILLTLGTGIGSSVWKNGKLIDRIELGHMVIEPNGEPCACGRKGCFETCASTTALIREIKRAVDETDTLMKNASEITGKTVFEYYESDKVAKQVFDKYLERLVCGIANCANIFQTETVILGGGICAALNSFLSKLEQEINAQVSFPIRLQIAKNKNNAGLLGATTLF